jgi:endonuclease/exonuclease/phosphatase family metal-dependent hydrolase
MHSIATFNANNFFLRYRHFTTFPGDLSKASKKEALEAVSSFLPPTAGGFFPKNYIIWDPIRRELAAKALRKPDNKLPDILCLQEIENIYAVRALNQQYLKNHYPYSLVIDGHDIRNIDVGLLSRFPLKLIRTHVDDRDKEGEFIFSRDCLEVTVALPDGPPLTLFINHLKSKLVQKEKNESEAEHRKRILASHLRRKAQAEAVSRLIDERFSGKHTSALYAVVGDFNDTPFSPYVEPLLSSPRLTDVVSAHRAADDAWTYFWRSPNRVSQIDYVLASKALAGRVAKVVDKHPDRKPHIERSGLAFKRSTSADAHILPANLVHFEADDVTPKPVGAPPKSTKIKFDFPRFKEVLQDVKNNISDHCPVKVWF